MCMTCKTKARRNRSRVIETVSIDSYVNNDNDTNTSNNSNNKTDNNKNINDNNIDNIDVLVNNSSNISVTSTDESLQLLINYIIDKIEKNNKVIEK